MQPESAESRKRTPELVTLNVIRVETALSRYPIHRLAKQGTTSIEIREHSQDGEMLIQWEVSHNSQYGQPGPLAYKLDTLLVNRRIEEASRPISRIIKLGSLKDICRELGLAENGKNTNSIKKSLFQNALAGITAKIRCRFADGTERSLEAVFTRYAVIFTGEKLPDGRTADAVYLELSDRFMHVLDGARTRPLDYDYLKDLPPAPQRLYELLSFQIYAALKYSRRQARLSYAEFCTYAPLTRHEEWHRVRSQMNKLHGPHKKSGYIQSVEFEQAVDRDGKPDWLMLYVPGPKARAEYRTFTRRGGPKTLEVEQASPTLKTVIQQVEPTPLERELIARGVTPSTAAELVSTYTEERISIQIDHLDWLKEKHPKKVSGNSGGFLASAIREEYIPLKGFETKAQRTAREEAKREKERQEAEASRLKEEGRRRELDTQARITAYLSGLDAQGQEQLDAEALKEADPQLRANFEQADTRMRRLFLRVIRETHVRRVLGISQGG